MSTASRGARRRVHKLHHSMVDRFTWEQIIRRAELPEQVKLLAYTLATYANGDGGRVRPGDELLADNCGRKERWVREQKAVLLELGLLETVAEGTPTRAAVYQLTLPAADHPPVPMRLDPDGDRYTDRPKGRAVYQKRQNTGTAVPPGEAMTGTPVPVENPITGTGVPVDNANDRHTGAGDPDNDRHTRAALPAQLRSITGTPAHDDRHTRAAHQYRPSPPNQGPSVVALADYDTYAASPAPATAKSASDHDDTANPAAERHQFAEAARAEQRHAFAAAADALGKATTLARDQAITAATAALKAEGVSLRNIRALTIRAAAILQQAGDDAEPP